MKLGIDATNISSGGGLNHLINLLANVDIGSTAFDKVYIWGASRTLAQLHERPWLKTCTCSQLDGNLFIRSWWKMRYLSEELRNTDCNILFTPGGSYIGNFHPFVTMSRNMLPFEWREMRRFGMSKMFFKLLLLRYVQTRTYHLSDGIIFLTAFARTQVLSVIGSLSARSEIIPHGINSHFNMDLENVQEAPEKKKELLRLIYVSIIDTYKHQCQVAKAVASLRKQGYPICIEFIGPAYGPALKKFNRLLDEIDPQRQFIIYTGNLPNTELPAHYAKADICVFASTCENMPNILLEGMAAGLPIACSRKLPMPEILGQAGVYFDSENPESIAIVLERLIKSPELRQELSEQSLAVARQYSWEDTASKTFHFLEQVAIDSYCTQNLH